MNKIELLGLIEQYGRACSDAGFWNGINIKTKRQREYELNAQLLLEKIVDVIDSP